MGEAQKRWKCVMIGITWSKRTDLYLTDKRRRTQSVSRETDSETRREFLPAVLETRHTAVSEHYNGRQTH